MHDLDYIKEKNPEEVEFLANPDNFHCPIYMRKQYFPHVTRYPLEDVVETLGFDYFESSIAFMFALAIHENDPVNTEIGMWGVHMAAQSEYAYQRPNMEWLLGLAQGMGFKVTLPDSARLLIFNGGKPKPKRDGRRQIRYSQWEYLDGDD